MDWIKWNILYRSKNKIIHFNGPAGGMYRRGKHELPIGAGLLSELIRTRVRVTERPRNVTGDRYGFRRYRRVPVDYTQEYNSYPFLWE